MTGRTPRALIVAYDFPPHGAVGTQRTLRVVSHLAAAGWDVHVLTSDPATFRRHTPVDRLLLDRVPESVDVWRARCWRPVEALRHRFGGATPKQTEPDSSVNLGLQPDARRRSRPVDVVRSAAAFVDTISAIPDREVGWILPAIGRALGAFRHEKPDVIYSSGPPWSGHLVALALAWVTGVPWVADFRDPWARAPWRSARAGRLANRAAKCLERIVVVRATAVIFATTATHDDFAETYGAVVPDKSVTIPNGCDPSMLDGIPARSAENSFVLLHAGSIYGGRSPVPVLRAAYTAITAGRLDRHRFRLRLLGASGAAVSDLRQTIESLQLGDTVEILPRLSHRDSLTEIKSASALLLLQQGTSLSIPAKLYEYLAAARPILALTDSKEIEQLLKTTGAGTTVGPGDAAALETAIVAMANGMLVTSPAPKLFYDGNRRAAETLSVLRRVMAGDCPVTDAGRRSLVARGEGP